MDSIWTSWDELNRLTIGKDVILFGAGHPVKNTIKKLKKQPLFIVDNNKSKENTYFFNLKILPPDSIDVNNRDIIILITTPIYESVIKQLKLMGLKETINFYCSPAINHLKISNRLKHNDKTILFTCGDNPEPEHSTSGGGLYSYNFKNRELTKLSSGKYHEFIRFNNRLYIIDELNGVRLFSLDFKLLDTFKILSGSVPHGLTVDPEYGKLFVANTMIDSISVIDAYNGKHLDEFDISKNIRHLQLDRHHINDLCYYEGYLYVSMFSFSGLWESGCYDGGVAQIDLETKRIVSYPLTNLWMPHSIDFFDNEIIIADSMRGLIYKTNNKRIFQMNGFARGLTYDGELFYFGQSEHRYFDRLRDHSNNIQINTGIHIYDDINKASMFFTFDSLSNIHSIIIKDF